MALHVEINRTDDRGREFLQRIEDTFPTDGEFVFRIAESEFALAVSSNVYDYYRLHQFFCNMGWLAMNYGGPSLQKRVDRPLPRPAPMDATRLLGLQYGPDPKGVVQRGDKKQTEPLRHRNRRIRSHTFQAPLPAVKQQDFQPLRLLCFGRLYSYARGAVRDLVRPIHLPFQTGPFLVRSLRTRTVDRACADAGGDARRQAARCHPVRDTCGRLSPKPVPIQNILPAAVRGHGHGERFRRH